MKTLLILSVSLLLSVFSLSAQEAGGPNIKFNKESHDFGKIIQGKPVTYEFKLTNTGSAPLTLVSVKASCGCTTPYYPKQPIAPGQSEKIKVTYNAASAGRFHKSVTVVTNIKTETSTNSKKVLFIKGEVVSSAMTGDKEMESPVRVGG